MTETPEFEDLSWLPNYNTALADKQWAYFFMRGCEGQNNCYNPPVYKQNSTAQHWWAEGYAYMEDVCDEHDICGFDDAPFVRAFLRAAGVGCRFSGIGRLRLRPPKQSKE